MQQLKNVLVQLFFPFQRCWCR